MTFDEMRNLLWDPSPEDLAKVLRALISSVAFQDQRVDNQGRCLFEAREALSGRIDGLASDLATLDRRLAARPGAR